MGMPVTPLLAPWGEGGGVNVQIACKGAQSISANPAFPALLCYEEQQIYQQPQVSVGLQTLLLSAAHLVCGERKQDLLRVELKPIFELDSEFSPYSPSNASYLDGCLSFSMC